MNNPSSTSLNVPFPYVVGRKFHVRSHVPPPPTPLKPGCCLESDAGRLERQKLHPIDRCLLHPPLAGSDGPMELDLEISWPLSVGRSNHRAQLVAVDVANADEHAAVLGQGKRLVAKIYDPLYATAKDNDFDPFLLMDKNYTHEAAAYTRLPELQGSSIPRYYGSFSLEIPTSRSMSRWIRLIMIEFIPGSPMQDIDPGSLSQYHRQRIMKTIIDFTTEIYQRDMVHEDLCPRNIMIINEGTKEQKVVFVDFEDMRFTRTAYGNPEQEARFFPKTYVSPLLKWHKARKPAYRFGGWVDWSWQRWLKDVYGHTENTITEEQRKKFLPDYLLKPTPIGRIEELYLK
ncbi:hypothetical protein Plec18167_005689 [Paecilomyces lecythidis]|uniref:EKC/KEOPS complex subunit BUD32 n=1 Tax=Paecilomyces lecythidis TaxID=3004212 RepID=A0ABR3XH27_9EURO